MAPRPPFAAPEARRILPGCAGHWAARPVATLTHRRPDRSFPRRGSSDSGAWEHRRYAAVVSSGVYTRGWGHSRATAAQQEGMFMRFGRLVIVGGAVFA